MNFIQFAEANGLRLNEVIADGRWHRVPTHTKPRKKNGAYLFDGRRGVVRDWAAEGFATWKEDAERQNVGRQVARDITRSLQAERERHAKARHEAAEIIRACERQTHPYLAAKGFPDALGLVHSNGDLIIPMRNIHDYGEVNSIQRIDANGNKLFLTGGKAKGSIFILGKGAWREPWLVEGYATGLSVQAALIDLRRPAEVVVCFSAGNMVYVSEFVRGKSKIFADHDASGTGQAAAEKTMRPWVMTPELGDANDHHQAHGLRALVKLILECE